MPTPSLVLRSPTTPPSPPHAVVALAGPPRRTLFSNGCDEESPPPPLLSPSRSPSANRDAGMPPQMFLGNGVRVFLPSRVDASPPQLPRRSHIPQPQKTHRHCVPFPPPCPSTNAINTVTAMAGIPLAANLQHQPVCTSDPTGLTLPLPVSIPCALPHSAAQVLQPTTQPTTSTISLREGFCGRLVSPSSTGCGASFLCPWCDRTFPQQQGLLGHISHAHSEARSCPLCAKVLGSVRGLVSHLREVHLPPATRELRDAPKIACAVPGCKWRARTFKSLAYHLRSKHPDDPVCPGCGERFDTMPECLSHIKANHADERPWLPSDVRQRLEDSGRFDIRGAPKTRRSGPPVMEEASSCASSTAASEDGGTLSSASSVTTFVPPTVTMAERG